jgi:primosomal protein N' (replication factor Y)
METIEVASLITLPETPVQNGPQVAEARAVFAEVAMDSPGLSEALTYRVPSALVELIQPGQLVWGPLKKGRAQGIVLSVSERSPDFKTRELSEIADTRPVLLPHQLELAGWMSRYYLSGLYEAATLMLPPGLNRAAKPTLTLTTTGQKEAEQQGTLSGLDGNELFLLQLILEISRKKNHHDTEEERPTEALVNDLKNQYTLRRAKTTFERTVTRLEEKGLVQRGFLLPRPGVRPKVKPFVRLAEWVLERPEDDELILQKLGRAPKQRQVLEILRRELEPGYLMPADEVCLLAETELSMLKTLTKKGLLEMEDREVRRDPLANRPQREKAEEPPLLTYRQSIVWRELLDNFLQPGPQTFLLHGVTGSGKTELYLRAIARVLREGKQAIVLVPEIALTAQTVDRFAARFPGRIAVRHSALSAGEAYDEWRRTRDGDADIVIGARSAIFSPLPRLGLIIIDEEHEWSYKQDDKGNLFYHTRAVAQELARLTGAKVILGSATPAIESYFQVEAGRYKLLELPDRVAPVSAHRPDEPAASPLPLPPVQVVDLRQELKSGNSSIFSRSLRHYLKETLDREQQAILFLNRRGTATIVMCRDCGLVVKCEECDTPLAYHADLERLVCHRCNRRQRYPDFCPNPDCKSEKIRHFGTGTKKVEDELLKLFPQARVLRWDQDTIAEGGRETYQVLFDKMARHEADFLVGTQMIAKGLDLPLVALVGVVTADTGLYLPDFRATERTFQLLTQVAGRAGRRGGPSRAVIQSYTPEQYAIAAASHHDYAGFYRQEMTFRLEHGYPPYSKLIKFVYSHKQETKARQEAEGLARFLSIMLDEAGVDPSAWDYIGPAPAFQHKLRGHYRYQFILRIHVPEAAPEIDPDDQAIRRVLLSQPFRRELHGWSVDVDPQSVL